MRAVLVGSRPAGDRRHLTLEARELAEAARPGQFVMVAVPGALLRRPFWIAGAERTTIDLFVEVAGPGTAWLTGQPVGSELDVLGPLGRPFPPPDGPAALVGDTGSGPLRFLAAQGAPVVPLGEASVAYAVGTPPPGIRSWVAVTAPMACGTGLCWTCAVPVTDGPPVRACVEGPVFEGARLAMAAPASEEARPAAREVDLTVRLGPVRLANPVLAAAGTAGASGELPGAGGLGALVAKTVTLRPRAGLPGPRMAETAGGMLNAIGLQNPGVDAWLADGLPVLLDAGVSVFASIAAETAAQFGEVAARLRGVPGILAVEANISCPNVEDRGRVFACRTGPTREAVAAAVEGSGLPVFAKLTADVTDITEIAAAAMGAGAAGLTVANTLLGLAIDAETRRPRLGGGMGGLSGPAVKPVALRAVAQVARALPDAPIIGVGGIRSVPDVVEFVLAGASAVAVGSASFAQPGTACELVAGLPGWLAAHGYRDIGELRGQVRW